MTTDMTGMSWTQLREAAAAVEQEVARREALDQAERDQQLQNQLTEIRHGRRRIDDEHVRHLTPAEVTEAVNRGQVPGFGPDRRLARRR